MGEMRHTGDTGPPCLTPLPVYSNTLLLVAVLLLAVLLAFVYFASAGSYFQDPLFCGECRGSQHPQSPRWAVGSHAEPSLLLRAVFVVFSFVSAIDLIISLEEDGFISGFAEVYVREVQPHCNHWSGQKQHPTHRGGLGMGKVLTPTL